MSAPVLLLVLAIVVGGLGGRLLAAASWPSRSPRLAVLMWQAASWCVVGSVIFAGLSLAVPSVPPRLGGDLASYLGVCILAVRQHYATPWGVAASGAGLLVALVVAGRAGHCLVRSLWATRRSRLRSRDSVALVAERDVVTGALVVNHPRPAVYCIPGRRATVVVTRGALDLLGRDELDSVLAHERAHLRGRHDLAVTAARALGAAFPFVPLFGQAAAHVPALVEMHADDRAVEGADGRALARALVRLAGGAVPVEALGATGGPALTRLHRLIADRRTIGPARAAVLVAFTALLLAGPAALAVAPAVETALLDYCHLLLFG